MTGTCWVKGPDARATMVIRAPTVAKPHRSWTRKKKHPREPRLASSDMSRSPTGLCASLKCNYFLWLIQTVTANSKVALVAVLKIEMTAFRLTKKFHLASSFSDMEIKMAMDAPWKKKVDTTARISLKHHEDHVRYLLRRS